MEIASKFLGMSSYRRYGAERSSTHLTPTPSSFTMRTHSYPKFMEQRTPGSSLYEKTFGFSNSPIKKSSRVMKHKRRSLEVSRCSNLEQREQYRRLIAQYRVSTLRESAKSIKKVPGSTKIGSIGKDANRSVIDLTGRTSPELPKKSSNKGILQQTGKLNDSSTSKTEIVKESSHSAFMPIKQPSVSVKDFISPYLSENFIPNLLKTFGRRERQRQIQTSAEETKARLYREKREAKEAILADILHEKLLLKEQKKEEPKLPELTAEMSDTINGALQPYPSHEVLVDCFNISITREHMSTLFGLNWLNDEIVNFYMELIVQRSKDCNNLPSIHAMNTFFYPRLYKQAYNSVRRWTKKVDIFAKDMVIYPIHLGVHWCLAVIDFTKKEIRYYDSMGGTNRECLETLRDYLASEHQNKKGSVYDLSGWELLSMADIPQQMNGSDCGVFTCKFAEYITLQKELSFSQTDMPYFRRAMVWEILNKKLLR